MHSEKGKLYYACVYVYMGGDWGNGTNVLKRQKLVNLGKVIGCPLFILATIL